MNKKILFASFIAFSSLPIALISTKTSNLKVVNKTNSNKIENKLIDNHKNITNVKTKYLIRIDGKEMIFNSKDEIVKYLVNKVNINHFIGKKEYKNYDGEIDMNSNKLNLVDFSKFKKAYKDIYGNYTDDLSSVIRSYLPEFAIVKRYYDHRNQPFKDEEDAKNSIIKNATDDIIENVFYKLEYSSNGIVKDKYYNPYNPNDINELMNDIYNKNVLQETYMRDSLKLKDKDGNERLLSYKGNIENFFTNLFSNAIMDFTNQAVKKRYKITLKLPRMDNMKYRDYGKAYFEEFSSNNEDEWIINNDRTEIYKYVDEEWIEKYFNDLELLKNPNLSKEFVNKNFKKYYSDRKVKKIKNPNYKKRPNRGPHGSIAAKEYVYYSYWDHFAQLKGKFLDFKNLTLAAKNDPTEWDVITILEKDKSTYNNFGIEINIQFDKDNFKNKMNNLKNEFMNETNKFDMFHSLLKYSMKKIMINEEDRNNTEKYFENLRNDLTMWNMLWNYFESDLNKFIDNTTKKFKNNFNGIKFDDLKTYYKKENDNWNNWKSDMNLKNIFNELKLSINDNIVKTYYYKNNPLFYKNDDNFINISNKNISNADYFDCIDPNKILLNKIINSSNLIQKQKDFVIKRKIDYTDNYWNYFNLQGLHLFKFKNFIQYKEIENNSLLYQLNNSYSSLFTFKDDTEIREYLRKIKTEGIKPQTRYTIVGLESTLTSHGIKMLINELGFNDPTTITNNYRAILQKLILPSTEKIFYINNGHKYLMDLKYFNLWNIELDNERHYFENSRDITKFIIKYVHLNAKLITRNGER